MCNLIRKYKCYKLTGEVNRETKEIFDFIDNKLKNLNKIDNNKFPDIVNDDWIFYMNSSGECILEYNLKAKYLYVRYKDFLEVLVNKYFLESVESLEYNLIEYIVKKFYKINIFITYIATPDFYYKIEKAYKLKYKII